MLYSPSGVALSTNPPVAPMNRPRHVPAGGAQKPLFGLPDRTTQAAEIGDDSGDGPPIDPQKSGTVTDI